MNGLQNDNNSSAPKSILVLSISQYLAGNPIAKSIEADWAKEKAHKVKHLFNNVGFDVDPIDVEGTLEAVRHQLEGRTWDGICIGWCIRGHVEFTVLFEKLVALCFEVVKSAPQTRIMFSTGPDNLVETALRNFPEAGQP